MHSACILLTGIKMGGMAPPYLKVGGGGGGGATACPPFPTPLVLCMYCHDADCFVMSPCRYVSLLTF